MHRSRRDDDRLPNGFGSGDGTVAYEFGDHATWTFQQEELSGELHISDFHPAVDIYPKGGQLAERVTAGHLEAAGAVTGRLTFAGSPYDIDGLAIRDRGWGVRIWEEILAHRWVAASFGAEATVYAVSLLGTSGQIAHFGCVILGDTLTYATDVDIITYLERDGVTHRGGHVRMELADGEIVDLEAEPLQKGAVSWMAGKAAINDTVCRISWGIVSASATSKPATTPTPAAPSRCTPSTASFVMACTRCDAYTDTNGFADAIKPRSRAAPSLQATSVIRW